MLSVLDPQFADDAVGRGKNVRHPLRLQLATRFEVKVGLDVNKCRGERRNQRDGDRELENGCHAEQTPVAPEQARQRNLLHLHCIAERDGRVFADGRQEPARLVFQSALEKLNR